MIKEEKKNKGDEKNFIILPCFVIKRETRPAADNFGEMFFLQMPIGILY